MTRKMFIRAKNGNLQVQDLDLAVVRMIAKYTYRRSSDIHRRFPKRTPKKHAERLRHLFDHGYLDRPRAQQHNHMNSGRTHYIYALGNHGAALLSERLGYAMPKSNWTQKNRLVQRPHIQHTLRVGDIVEAVDYLQDTQPHICGIPSEIILKAAPPRTQNDPKPWAWRARTQDKHGNVRQVVAKPDFVFGLDDTIARKRFYYWVECDRGTEPVLRSQKRQTSVGRKFQAYAAGYRAALHTSRYGIGNVRFLMLTTSQERIDTMLEALAEITPGDASMFLFAESDTLLTAPDLLALPCRDGHGQAASLLPTQTHPG